MYDNVNLSGRVPRYSYPLPMPTIQQDMMTESMATTKYEPPQAYHTHLVKNKKKIMIKATLARKFFH